MTKMPKQRKAGRGARGAFGRLALGSVLVFLAAAALRAEDKVTWKRIPDAMLKIDNRPVKVWTLYHAEKEKKENRLLLQVGSRYLMIDTRLRLITEYDRATFSKKGEGYEMDREARGVKALPTEDWILRDVGTSYLIHAKLKEEGRALEIQLPKMPDFRNVLW
jgi:hypothetical protein